MLTEDFDEFVSEVFRRLERALVARYGVDLGVDAAADAIAYAWEHREALAQTSNPIGYLYRVGQTSVRRTVRLQRPLILPPEAVVDGYRSVEDSEFSLPDAVAKLPDAQRVAVVLVHAHGYSYADAAEVLDVPVTTLRNHLHRGMSRLRALLEDPR